MRKTKSVVLPRSLLDYDFQKWNLFVSFRHSRALSISPVLIIFGIYVRMRRDTRNFPKYMGTKPEPPLFNCSLRVSLSLLRSVKSSSAIDEPEKLFCAVLRVRWMRLQRTRGAGRRPQKRRRVWLTRHSSSCPVLSSSSNCRHPLPPPPPFGRRFDKLLQTNVRKK